MSKSNFSRRKFIKGSTYATLAAGLSSTAAFGSEPFKFISNQQAVIIGSGFGGSVTALRLGQAGIKTALLERGKRWSYNGPDSFPTLLSMTQGDPRCTWLGEFDAPSGRIPTTRYTGMMERIEGDNADSVCGAGLGGGSLVYGGVLLQPKREYFNLALPYVDYDAMDSEYYPRVLSYVSGGSIPNDILAAPNYAAKRAFIENALAGGLEVVKSHVGFDWDIIRKELTGERPMAASIGDYVFSCNSGAKKTLDTNYIAAAEATGNVDVLTMHNVMTIKRRGRRGAYEVHCDILNPEGTVVGHHIILCKYVFLAAGSINSTRLLLKTKAMGDLDGINDAVGYGWAANGDELMARVGVTSDLGPVQGGPPSIAAWDNNNNFKPVGFMHSPSNSRPGQAPTQIQMAMTISDETGSVSYDPTTDKAFLNWPSDANSVARAARYTALEKITANSGGVTVPDTAMGRTTLWHPLGGCVMGEATDIETGEVFGQSGLFVMDGALMPGSTGMANPALTIGANAERLMDNILNHLC